jgi:hypothetical protein
MKHTLRKTAGPVLAALTLTLGLAACDVQQESESATQTGAEVDGEGDAMEGMSRGDEEGQGSGDHASMQTSLDLTATLLTRKDLPSYPSFYAKGVGHHQTDRDAAAPKVGPACAPVAELIGTHPSVHQTRHPQAAVTFTNGHFGQQVSETIIDYGDTSSAQQARDRFERAGRECGRYVQSTSPIGANVYTVKSEVPRWNGPEGSTLRLEAVGSDFKNGLNWDVWVTRSDSRLVAVALRSALGGSNDDLRPAVVAARAAFDQS